MERPAIEFRVPFESYRSALYFSYRMYSSMTYHSVKAGQVANNNIAGVD
jgi:hypothetical protein